jgi:hypothetical protein
VWLMYVADRILWLVAVATVIYRITPTACVHYLLRYTTNNLNKLPNSLIAQSLFKYCSFI